MTAKRGPAARLLAGRRWSLVAATFLSAMWLGVTLPGGAAGEYFVSNWDETIVVNLDASLTITENVTFTYLSGDFGFVFRTLVHRGFDELRDVSVIDDTGNRVDHTVTGGTFFQDYEIRWEFPRIFIGAEPVQKTFALRYVLTNAMNFENPDADVDRLFWNIVTDYDVRIEDMDIDVILPGSFALENVTARAYVSSGTPLPADVQEGDPTVVQYHHPTLRAGDAYTVDTLFSPVVQRPPARSILEGPEYLIVLVPATIPLLVWVYRRKRRDPPAADDASLSELKQNLRPAEAGVLAEGSLQPRHLVATALSLAEEGYLEILPEFDRQQELEGVRFVETEEDTAGLKEHERSVYRQLGGRTDRYLARGRRITSTEDYHALVADGEEIKSGLLDQGYAERNFFSPFFGVRQDRVFGVVIPLAFLILTVTLVYYGGLIENGWLFVSGILSIIPLGLSMAVSGHEKRRTTTGARFKRSIDSNLRNLVSQVESSAEGNPYAAAETIKDNASWLVLEVDQSWFRKVRRRLERGMLRSRYEGFELPSYVRTPAELVDIETTTALMVLFGAYDRTYAGTSAYYAAAAASSPSSGGSGGGGGAGGGGGGGGGGSG